MALRHGPTCFQKGATWQPSCMHARFLPPKNPGVRPAGASPCLRLRRADAVTAPVLVRTIRPLVNFRSASVLFCLFSSSCSHDDHHCHAGNCGTVVPGPQQAAAAVVGVLHNGVHNNLRRYTICHDT